MEYLVRKKLSKQQKKGRRPVVAHLWDGADTLCQMYSTGGIRRKTAYAVEREVSPGARLCTMCVEASEGKHLDEAAREAIWRDRGPSGSDLAEMMEAADA